MSRIAETFAALRASNKRALIPYLTAGFPNLNSTGGLLHALVRGGADIIELGVPFSDPIADGPTIQRASTEALRAGTTLPAVLQMVRQFRTTNADTPVVLFGAYNPFFHYGLERLAEDLAAAGADALLIPDVPAEEGAEVEPILRGAGLDLIYLVAPTTPMARKREICAHGSGFIYYISLKGVTGARTNLTLDLHQPLSELREATDLPIAVGFGIGTPEQATAVARSADGVVVGSALIDLIFRNSDSPELEKLVEDYMRSMKAGVAKADQATAAVS